MRNFTLSKDRSALLVIDVQDRLISQIERPCEILHAMHQIVKGVQIMQMPIVVTEQYPQGLGRTIASLRDDLGEQQEYFSKTTFSCCDNAHIREYLLSLPVDQWIVVGLEAHICILQSVKALLAMGKQVVVLNDCISSRSIYDFSTAIAELRDLGVRISSTETILFELLKDSQADEFKQISQLVR